MQGVFKGKRIHFIGVGGISMSALIRIAAKLGAEVSGSDRSGSEAFLSLREQGYDVYLGERKEYAERADIVVYNAAIKESNVERVAAGEKGITRAAFLSDICAFFKKTVAVSGTHGKTTVSAMIACSAAAGGAKFSAHIGGIVRNFDGNTFLAGEDLFITEACEYKDSFLSLSPDVAIILNAEKDHSDYFKSMDMIYSSFSAFASRVRKGGILILGEGVSPHIRICASDDMTIYRFGEDFDFDKAEGGGFYLKIKGEPPRYFITSAKGRHNRYNAAISAFACLKMGLSEDAVRMGLAAFLGVKRRYEYMGNTEGGAPVVQDYAHHPSEIRAVMQVAREETEGRLIVVFEPHTYSRTKGLFREFAEVLSSADVLVMLPTYSAREVPSEGVDAKTLFYEIKAPERYYFSDYDAAETLLRRLARSRDTVLILGAGSVFELAERFRRG